MTEPAIILLHPDDTVVVCVRPVAEGELLDDGMMRYVSREATDTGHKIARRAGRPGDKVIKYGTPIGSLTGDVEAGTWVHLHNMKSDYLDAHTRAAFSQGAS